jgi:hypothetical protein
MQPKKIRYTLTYSGTDYVLDNAPDGWDENLIKWGRSEKYYGLFRSFSIPLGFVGDGRAVVRRAYYTDGVEALVTMKIERLVALDWTYETWYEGRLDFTTYKEEKSKATVNIMDAGLSMLVKNNEDKEYGIRFTGGQTGSCYFYPIYGTAVARAALTASGLFTKLIDAITGGGVTAGTYEVQCDYFDNMTDFFPAFFPGKVIRISAATTVNVKFSDFFKALNSAENVGFGVKINPSNGKQVAVLENKAHFFNGLSEVLDAGTVSELKVSVASEYIYNSLTISSEKKEYSDTTLSNYEPNGETKFSIPITVKKGELDLKCPYRMDWHGVWDIYTNFTNDPTITEEFDNDIFLMCMKDVGGGYFTPDDGEIKKVSDATVYDWQNIAYTPRRLLLKHFDFLLSGCDKLPITADITLTSSTVANDDNICRRLSDMTWLNEFEPLDVVDDGSKLFQPIYFEFKAPSNVSMVSLMTTLAEGYITFDWNGITLYGFVVDVGANPDKRKSLGWKLLATPACDLLDLLPIIAES